MNARVVLLLLWPITASAQGFAGLGTDVDGFSSPQRPAQFDFPTDHGPHYDYRIEWWYLTANLEGLDGTPYGLQWTLFRSALTSDGGKGWSSPQLWMGHAAVTTPDAHFVTERLARGGIGQAGVQADPFEAWIDDWQLVGPDFATLAMTASGPEFAYDMVLKSDGPLVFHGDEGYSVKSAEGQASFYYSQPFYAIEGTLILPTGSIEVAGDAWLDREWSSQPLSDNQTGWDWFSLSLEDGKLMGFRLRQTDGSYYTSATWIDPNGSATSYANGAFEADPVAISDVGGRDVPTTWNVRLPDRGVDVEVTAINPQAWMDTSVPYWEGPIIVLGSHTGRGYLEMTGYD
ncbi:iron ABC transporter permease [Planktomarina temperata]|jgi:predicted secreted hydrolase|uniref:lipocalin-like domain-containing protein n=2 Tax=Planktomarina TaxID=1284657 RepID=UPI002325A692|nr:iron ABC transporter permease [Planktomarina temperata]MDO7557745.1 iron ABC transporter permease [Loktanella sp.]MDA8723056.1 iron ABC transporter permease [Planktomarina temperata]MDB2460816.1 iron ABC transporter permease [Planktomarina temperata]MDC0640370.1 iron ABC transporter permease [Planktomarina temperata]